MENVLSQRIEAIVPIYTKEGCNSTCIKLYEKDMIMEKSLKRILKDICAYYHYDLKTANKDYGKKINLKKTIPIPLTKDIVFIGVKTRNPIGKDDGAFSYVNIETIDKVKNGIIYFKNQTCLKTLARDETIEKHINLAKLLKDISMPKRNLVREEESPYDNLSLREDLLMVYKRLQKIEKRLLDQGII